MKNIGILFLSLMPTFLMADEICEDDIFSINGNNEITRTWLFREDGDGELGPGGGEGGSGGLDCDFGVMVYSDFAMVGDEAYFSKSFDPAEMGDFQFTLKKNELLESFQSGDHIDIFTFQVGDPSIYGARERRYLKIDLQKPTSNDLNSDWIMGFTWYNDRTGPLSQNPVRQTMAINGLFGGVWVKFFWNTSESWDNDQISSGLLVRNGGHPIEILMNPFLWNSPVGGFGGIARLGYLNANDNPAEEYDQIAFTSRRILIGN